ncbi:transglycosylase SLT domain-containing protein [Acidisoma sp. C75]
MSAKLVRAPRGWARRLGRPLRLAGGIGAMALLAACAAHNSHISASQQAVNYRSSARGDYAPPGPPSDPWGPYIAEASRRFDVPQSWIRNVIHVESGGHEYINGQLTTSDVGAMGLMQLMPQTYQELEAQYGLGDDPFNPHDNIMAGTAYLREMYDLFGSPGFLAAYNAGPQRLNEYLTDGRPLPAETTHYLAMIEPHIQGDMPSGRSPADQFAMNSMTAPSAAPYGGGSQSSGPSLAETGGGLVGSPGVFNGMGAGSGARGGGTLVAMNQIAPSAPIAGAVASPAASGESATEALNDQQFAAHAATLAANGGGAVPADLIMSQQQATAPAATAAPVVVASAALPPPVVVPAQPAYRPAVVEASPAAAAPAPLPARQPVFQVAPAYQSAKAPAAPVPAGTRLAENAARAAAFAPATYRPAAPAVIGPGGMQNLAAEIGQPVNASYQPPVQHGLHLIAPAEADTLPATSAPGPGGWGIQVGAFGSAGDARHAISLARHSDRIHLAAARSIVMPVQVSAHTLYRARLAGLSQNSAVTACQDLREHAACMVLSPDALAE